jgi:hypothetical protein
MGLSNWSPSNSSAAPAVQKRRTPHATRPIEVLQPIHSLAEARLDYLDSVLLYNRSQFRLNRALGPP